MSGELRARHVYFLRVYDEEQLEEDHCCQITVDHLSNTVERPPLALLQCSVIHSIRGGAETGTTSTQTYTETTRI